MHIINARLRNQDGLHELHLENGLISNIARQTEAPTLGPDDLDAGGERGVEMDVRLDKGWHHQIAAGIQIVRAQGPGFGLAADAADQAVFQVQLMQAFLVAQTGIDDVHRADPFGESFRRYPYVSSPAANPASSKCGSEPAREGGVSVTINADSHTAFASKSDRRTAAPTQIKSKNQEDMDMQTKLLINGHLVNGEGPGQAAVSYTHLTLPTIYSV